MILWGFFAETCGFWSGIIAVILGNQWKMTESLDSAKIETSTRIQAMEPETSNNIESVKRSDSEHELKVKI
jgi:hypothetical protein